MKGGQPQLCSLDPETAVNFRGPGGEGLDWTREASRLDTTSHRDGSRHSPLVFFAVNMNLHLHFSHETCWRCPSRVSVVPQECAGPLAGGLSGSRRPHW